MSKPKVLLTSGGTGGHIFPSLALGEALRDVHGCNVLFAGGHLSQNPYFEQNLYSYRDVLCGKWALNPLEWLKIGLGVIQSIQLIKKFDPDIVLGFGSYYTVPLLAAAKILGKPLFLHESNSIPGRVNRYFSPYAEMTWVHFPSTIGLLTGPAETAKMPLRPLFKKGMLSKEKAREGWGLNPAIPTFLVFGGSQGAEVLNTLFVETACTYLKKGSAPFQVIHFTGDKSEAITEAYKRAGILAYVRPFEKRMDIAWAAADLAITRSGAASFAEQVEYEVPGIFIPYPHSTDGHQRKNAAYADLNGLGIKREQAGLTSETLAHDILRLLEDKKGFAENFQHYKGNFCEYSLADKIMNRIKNGR